MTERVNVIWLDESDRDKTNVIYMLIFPNWRYYIGQTSQKLYGRVLRHSIISEQPQTKKERAIKKYKTFHVMVLDNCKDLDELNVKEQYWIELYDTFKNGYNSTTGGDSYRMSDETRRKIGNSNKGKIVSDETRKKLSKSHKGKTRSDETKRKICEAGRNVSDETRKKLSEAGKGRIVSDETRRKIGKSSKGKIISDETRKKLSKSHKGKTLSDEHRRGISEANKGKKRSEEFCEKMSEMKLNKIKCKSIPDNIIFDSIKLCVEYYTKLYGGFHIYNYLDNGKTHIKSGQTFVRITNVQP